MGDIGLAIGLGAAVWFAICIVVVGVDKADRASHQLHAQAHAKRMAAAKDEREREIELAARAMWLDSHPEPGHDWSNPDAHRQGPGH